MTLAEQIAQQVGPPPQAPADLRFLGWRLNPAAQEEYELKSHAYRRAMDAATAALTPQILNPLRESTLGEVSQLSGRRPEDIATPQQFNTRTEMQPSMTPSFEPRGVRPGPEPLFYGLTPHAAQMTPELGQLRQAPSPVIQQFIPREGSPLEVQVREPNLQAPSTLPQQLLGVSSLERESKWPRSMNAGGSAGFKYNQIAQAYGKDVADYWLAEGMLPEGAKAQNLQARTESSVSRGGLLEAQKQGQHIKNEFMPRQYNDQHENVQSQIDARTRAADRSDRMAKLRERMMTLDSQLKEGRLRGDTPEAQIAQGRLDLARKNLDFMMNFAVRNKLDLNDPSVQLLEEHLADLAGIEGDIRSQNWFMKMFQDTPQVRRKPQEQPSQQPTQQKPQSSVQQPQGDITATLNDLIKRKGVDAAAAQERGIEYKGKLYTYKDGKWSE